MCSRFIIGLISLTSVFVSAMAQEVVYDTTYDTSYVKYFNLPVTYFDYRIDGSNPDFGMATVTERWNRITRNYVIMSGWVDSFLTADRVPKRNPALTDTFLSISWNIEKIFKKWTPGVVDTFVWKPQPEIQFIYDSLGEELLRIDTIPGPAELMISDTLYKNIEIKDSVKAYWIPNAETYDDETDSNWFVGIKSPAKENPLFNKGFGQEDEFSTTNEGYTLTLRNKFTYHGGERIYLAGDDDCYLFINGKLAIEGGGFHETDQVVSLDLDSMHLTVGQKYDLDVFMVERRMGGNFYFGGLSDYEVKGSVRIDTIIKTIVTERAAVIPHSQKELYQQGMQGLRIPKTSQKARVEYFSVSGAKIVDRVVPASIASLNKSVTLPAGMYMVRVTFLNAQGKLLSTGSIRQMVVRK